jgi:hypothetical protein
MRYRHDRSAEIDRIRVRQGQFWVLSVASRAAVGDQALETAAVDVAAPWDKWGTGWNIYIFCSSSLMG